jgi:hypothetical protein
MKRMNDIGKPIEAACFLRIDRVVLFQRPIDFVRLANVKRSSCCKLAGRTEASLLQELCQPAGLPVLSILEALGHALIK